MVHRLILASWARDEGIVPPVIEGVFTDDELKELNEAGYNCYFLPNVPSNYREPNPGEKKDPVRGKDIDTFSYCFVDMDLKDGKYADKETFIAQLNSFALKPSTIVDSGNGIHAYWRIGDLDSMSYLRLQRRLCRYFQTDEATCSIYQLMRIPNTLNVKKKGAFKLCQVVDVNDTEYTCEMLDKLLPKITREDEEFCKGHFDKTYNIDETKIKFTEELPQKFHLLLKNNEEINRLFFGPVKDRSAADFRLAHLLMAQGLTREEAMSVLINTSKAIERAPIHRYNYAKNIVDKVWTEVNEPSEDLLSSSVRDILRASLSTKQETRFPCSELVDATEKGYRLSEVLGLIGAPGNGKTTIGLNFFLWFAERNPEYIHLFVSLEQPENEIAARWNIMTEGNDSMSDKVHILGNYNKDKTYRNLSLADIQEYVLKLEASTGIKVGCVVIDHVGVLKCENYKDKSGLPAVFAQLKSFAVTTNTFLVVQSQTSRDKADYGDVELDQNAAYGGAQFEWYCDYIMTTWQPLKRVYHMAPHMTVNAFKYAKIRGKKVLVDKIQENQVYALMFNPKNERLRQLTKEEMIEYEFFAQQALKIRKRDRKNEPTPVNSITWMKLEKVNSDDGKSDSN